MVFVTGGIGQGKYEFAKTLSAQVARDVHEQIRACMEQGSDPWAYASQLAKEYNNGVITFAELGCGLVPTDAFEREYRETAGRIACVLAAQAQAVYRVCCGISQQLK